jgi:acetylornithine deacetylase/succinyl-diaminopimelate desuccinylase-like protein
MADRQPSFDVTEGPRLLLEGLVGGVDGNPEAALERVRERAPWLAQLLEPMLGVTLAPTMIGASEKLNVVPSQAQLKVDCRVPPGLGEDVARRRIEEVLGPEGYRLEFTEQVVGNASPATSPLMDAIAAWLETEDPGAVAVPTILPGYTDSRTFRDAFPDCVAYGFFPHRHMTLDETAPLVHGADERIDARDVEVAARFFADVAQRLLG